MAQVQRPRGARATHLILFGCPSSQCRLEAAGRREIAHDVAARKLPVGSVPMSDPRIPALLCLCMWLLLCTSTRDTD